MTTETQRFQWSDIISLTENTYDTYLKQDKKDRDKYMKFEVKATVGIEQEADLKRFGIDPQKQFGSIFKNERDMSISKMLLKQMKYHCGKPLKLSLEEKGPGKHMPIIDYFERNKDYLDDYDYMIIDQRQYTTLLDENFLLFQTHDWTVTGMSGIDHPLNKVGKLRNLEVFTTWQYPDKDLRMDEFDVIIGRKDWVDADLVTAYEGETTGGYMNKYLLKMQFPVKRGFMRLKAEMKA